MSKMTSDNLEKVKVRDEANKTYILTSLRDLEATRVSARYCVSITDGGSSLVRIYRGDQEIDTYMKTPYVLGGFRPGQDIYHLCVTDMYLKDAISEFIYDFVLERDTNKKWGDDDVVVGTMNIDVLDQFFHFNEHDYSIEQLKQDVTNYYQENPHA